MKPIRKVEAFAYPTLTYKTDALARSFELSSTFLALPLRPYVWVHWENSLALSLPAFFYSNRALQESFAWCLMEKILIQGEIKEKGHSSGAFCKVLEHGIAFVPIPLPSMEVSPPAAVGADV